MSLHLGSSKYDEHTVRKVISKRYFKYLHPLCSICFPGHREHAGLEDKALATPGPAVLPSVQPHPATTLSHCGGAVQPGSAPCPEAAAPPGPSCSRGESTDIPPGKRGCPAGMWSSTGQGMLPPPWREGGTVLTASAGKPRLRARP